MFTKNMTCNLMLFRKSKANLWSFEDFVLSLTINTEGTGFSFVYIPFRKWEKQNLSVFKLVLNAGLTDGRRFIQTLRSFSSLGIRWRVICCPFTLFPPKLLHIQHTYTTVMHFFFRWFWSNFSHFSPLFSIFVFAHHRKLTHKLRIIL